MRRRKEREGNKKRGKKESEREREGEKKKKMDRPLWPEASLPLSLKIKKRKSSRLNYTKRFSQISPFKKPSPRSP